ncbi:glutamine synthetase, chloroplastic [Iris pallida]|uniref:Glutamine synthetase, chloroplastic n=1 Tax=Iris pallida TaxID=29817 RepID=A0AAX6I2R1_IRIPA|nr:glutamine synthetase, chloroplastic [Iris pallida]
MIYQMLITRHVYMQESTLAKSIRRLRPVRMDYTYMHWKACIW